MIVHRVTRKIKIGKMEEYSAQHAKIEARWQALGMPPVRQYRKLGSHTIVGDREFESLAAFEAAGAIVSHDPELNALRPALYALVEDDAWEFYTVV